MDTKLRNNITVANSNDEFKTGKKKSKKEIIDCNKRLLSNFIEIIEFDTKVVNYIHQPVVLEYIYQGLTKSYSPEFLVNLQNDTKKTKESWLCEIISLDALRKNRSFLIPKFKSALLFCKKNNLRFKIFTERKINSGYLNNIRFLTKFRNSTATIKSAEMNLLMKWMSELKRTTPDEIISISTNDEQKKAELIYALWYMISVTLINCDLTKKLTMESQIWI